MKSPSALLPSPSESAVGSASIRVSALQLVPEENTNAHIYIYIFFLHINYNCFNEQGETMGSIEQLGIVHNPYQVHKNGRNQLPQPV